MSKTGSKSLPLFQSVETIIVQPTETHFTTFKRQINTVVINIRLRITVPTVNFLINWSLENTQMKRMACLQILTPFVMYEYCEYCADVQSVLKYKNSFDIHFYCTTLDIPSKSSITYILFLHKFLSYANTFFMKIDHTVWSILRAPYIESTLTFTFGTYGLLLYSFFSW